MKIVQIFGWKNEQHSANNGQRKVRAPTTAAVTAAPALDVAFYHHRLVDGMCMHVAISNAKHLMNGIMFSVLFATD